ncbi:MAG: hypothetical protein INQ03_19320 [Candidatus Heimdallarchaeota archaeon]|nr:hypothetical protein [Candidatus Heimdallarchaeota archaeon]
MDPQEKKISELVTALTKIALADGKISPKEAAILESVQINFILYDQALESALEDGVIDQSEKTLLTKLKNKIMGEAADIVNVSEGVSEAEMKLLEVLLKNFDK